MDYEKKYKEVLERAKNINNEHRAQPFDVMTRVFPELKESKDEKIRKEIISALKFAYVKGVYDKHIAWLEKQGDKPQGKSALEAINEEKVEDVIHVKYDKYAWSEEDETKIKSIIAFLKSPSLCAMDGNKGIIDENIKYLNSLKERLLPQPKKEWSEEDNKALDSILNDLRQGVIPDNDDIDWLKSLKERMKVE